MTKMTETEIHAVLDRVKEGDVVRAVLEGKAKEGYKKLFAVENRIIRFTDGSISSTLVSVENLGQSEPEVGNFALLDIGVIARAQHHERGTWTEIRWHYFGDTSACQSWAEIKPLIKVLYNPDGSINEGWK